MTTRLRTLIAGALAGIVAGACAPGAPAEPGSVAVRLDASAAGRPISPLVYGVAGADAGVVARLGATLDRWGGNPSSTYNWAAGHDWNAGRDWEFRNANYTGSGGSAADEFVAAARSAGAAPLITVPTMGWVARNDDNATRSVNVPGEGGPPVRPGSQAIAGYDPSANRAATSVPSRARKGAPFTDRPDPASPVVYQDEWVHHLTGRFGDGAGGVHYYAMDNEPDLWSTTHTDVHPARMGYDDMLANFEEYATAVRAQAPDARILGPDVSGWTSYLYSDLDRGDDRFATHADRARHGDQPFLPWWLAQVAKADAQRGVRTLDLLDVHYYPQAQGVYSAAADDATRERRIQSVRSLYDPDRADDSWIADRVMLIPRLKRWIAAAYPGTGIAITEYSFGGEKDASGAVAEAEALGVFGREGVDVAAYWTYPPPDTPVGAAFRLYRNYDGRGGTFGDRSLPVTSSSSSVAAFASRHSDTGEVDVVLANESLTGTATVSLDAGAARGYSAAQFRVAAGSAEITRIPMAGASSAVSLPPMTLSLIRLLPARAS
ncbi:MAG TPA: glycoside hydrolase family 44 protein [Candidatus Dormibacteraeota bacterium]